jgi:hypothetical protein
MGMSDREGAYLKPPAHETWEVPYKNIPMKVCNNAWILEQGKWAFEKRRKYELEVGFLLKILSGLAWR